MIDLLQKTEFQNSTFEQLKKSCLSCERCVLSKTRTQVVVGSGPINADIMIIGEGPGEQEDLQGLPFVGRSGQLLTKILESVHIDREKEVYIANVVKCRPPQNRTPLPEEIESCKPFLIRQIQLIQPRILILLGAPSVRTILQTEQSISKIRGVWHHVKVDYMDDPLYVMPMFHPSYLLRQPSKEQGSPKWLTWKDAQEVKAALDFYRSGLIDTI